MNFIKTKTMSKKKFVAAVALVAVALFSGVSAYNNANDVELSDLEFANVEALAGGEIIIYPPCMWQPYSWCLYLHPDPNDDFELEGDPYV